MRSNTLFYGLTLLTGALAADDIVTIIAPGDSAPPPALIGKQIGAQSDQTSYSLTCASTVTSCEVPGSGVTLVEGPSTYQLQLELDNEPYTVACALTSSAAACSIKLGTEEWSDAFTETLSSYTIAVTATEGGVGLSTTPTATASPSQTESNTVTRTATESANTTETPEAENADGDEDADAEAEETDSDNAALAMVTGMPMQWAGAVAMGVAAVAMV